MSPASSHDKKRSKLPTQAKRHRGRPPLRSIYPNRYQNSIKVAETVLRDSIDLAESTESTDSISSSSSETSSHSSEDDESLLPPPSKIRAGASRRKGPSIASNIGSFVDIDDVAPIPALDITDATYTPPRLLRTQSSLDSIGSKHLRFNLCLSTSTEVCFIHTVCSWACFLVPRYFQKLAA